VANRLTILGVHGLGDHRTSTWKDDWEKAVRAVFPGLDDIALDFKFITYDPIFETEQISAWDTAQAVWKLTSSAVTSSRTSCSATVSGPQILGPNAIVQAHVPWMTAAAAPKKAKKRTRRKVVAARRKVAASKHSSARTKAR